MFIQTESTPNPLTLKLIPGKPVHPTGTAFYTSRDQAGPSPLAQALFALPEVTAVFLANDFITVTRTPEVEWDVIKPALLTAIMDHYLSGKPVVVEAPPAKAQPASSGSDVDQEIINQIRELIDTRVRPSVAMDGGDILFHDFKDGVVQLEMHGACSGCPSSTMTLKQGIENMLKHYIPEVRSVEAVSP